MEKKMATATLDREQDALELFAEQHQPKFETIHYDEDGNIMFCYPVPGAIYADPDNPFELTDAWEDYVEKHFPAWLAEHPEAAEVLHRTHKMAGDVFPVARVTAQITHPDFDKALTTRQIEGKNAFLQLTSANEIGVQSNMLLIDGEQQPNNPALLNKFYIMDISGRMARIDLPMLNVLFATLKNAIDANPEKFIVDKRRAIYSQGVLRIFVPELMEALGGQSNCSQAQYNAFVSRIAPYHSVLGIIKSGGKEMAYPLMSLVDYDVKDNTISLTSPYMVAVYECLALPRLKLGKDGKPVRNKHKEEVALPNYAYLIKSELYGQKSQRAIALVEEIIYLIVRTGSEGTPHIRIRKLLEYVPELDELALDPKIPAKKASDVIAQTFKTTWAYLDKYTRLREAYKDIQIPTIIPRMKTINKVLEFPHNGLTDSQPGA